MPELHPIPTHHRFKNLTRLVFGRLTVIGYVGCRYKKSMWLCRCSCGRETICNTSNLTTDWTTSCGCWQQESRSFSNTVHGMSKGARNAASEYRVWQGMRDRCLNSRSKRFCDYGGRGVTVCERWDRFENFYADMGPRQTPLHSLDRIDVNGNYEPSNCRWATDTEQSRNRRSNRKLTAFGKTLCLVEWGELLGIPAVNISRRLARGRSAEEALSTTFLAKRKEAM